MSVDEETGMRTWIIGSDVYKQVKPMSRRFLRRGDVFDIDKLDAFRVQKLARDKHFTAVVKITAEVE